MGYVCYVSIVDGLPEMLKMKPKVSHLLIIFTAYGQQARSKRGQTQ